MLASAGGTLTSLAELRSISRSLDGTKTVESMLLTALTNRSIADRIDCWEQENDSCDTLLARRLIRPVMSIDVRLGIAVSRLMMGSIAVVVTPDSALAVQLTLELTLELELHWLAMPIELELGFRLEVWPSVSTPFKLGFEGLDVLQVMQPMEPLEVSEWEREWVFLEVWLDWFDWFESCSACVCRSRVRPPFRVIAFSENRRHFCWDSSICRICWLWLRLCPLFGPIREYCRRLCHSLDIPQ